MFYTFVSFIFLEKYIEEKSRWIYLLLAGIFAGLSAATHLNALAVMASGFILLLWNGKWKGAFLYSLGALLTFSIYFFDFKSGYGVSYWLYQYFESPSVDDPARSGVLLYFVWNLLDEHMRFFHNPEIIGFSLLVLFALFGGFKYLNTRYKNMLRFVFLLFFFIALISTHKSRQYILVYFPFLVIFITVLFDKILNRDFEGIVFFQKKWTRITFLILVASFIGIGFYYNLMLSIPKFNTKVHHEITEKYIKENPSDVNIIAPMIFIFNEIKNYGRIHGEITYMELQKFDSTIYYNGFLKKADEYEIDYIYLSPVYRNGLGMDDLRKGEELGGFKVLEENHEMILLKKIKKRSQKTEE